VDDSLVVVQMPMKVTAAVWCPTVVAAKQFLVKHNI
jgi:hypothetical protein